MKRDLPDVGADNHRVRLHDPEYNNFMYQHGARDERMTWCQSAHADSEQPSYCPYCGTELLVEL